MTVSLLLPSTLEDVEASRHLYKSKKAHETHQCPAFNALSLGVPLPLRLPSTGEDVEASQKSENWHKCPALNVPLLGKPLSSPLPSSLEDVKASEHLHKSDNAQDPHQPPSFDTPGTAEPLLYLPPLLSALPLQYATDYETNWVETRLPDIDPASLSLHKALHKFRPVTQDYATVPYDEAFNWSQLKLPSNEEREWYCVVFRSRRKEGSDSDPLYSAERLAHKEAIRNGGLILYWYGIPHPETRMNLATCIWQSRKHAIAANSRPDHIIAMKLTAASYDVYALERYVLRKMHGEEGVTIEPFIGGEVGW